MIARIIIHGDHQLLDAMLDFGDAQPAVGWEIDLDVMGRARIYSIVFSPGYGAEMHLTPPPACWDAGEAVSILTSKEFPEWTDVQLGEFCYCDLCPNPRER